MKTNWNKEEVNGLLDDYVFYSVAKDGTLEQFKKDKGLLPTLEDGTYVKIISAGDGASGCNGRVGFVTAEEGNMGKVHKVGNINIHLIDGSIWTVNGNFKYELLTHEEVETALKAEAIKRGFKEGVTVETAMNGFHRIISNNELYLFNGRLYTTNAEQTQMCLMNEDGKWAAIIEDTQLDKLEKKYKELGEEIQNLKTQ